MLITLGAENAIDVTVVPSPYAFGRQNPKRPLEYFEGSLQIAEDLWLADFDSDFADAVFDACSRRGENFTPTRQFGGPYGFVRTGAPLAQPLQFDPDGRLYACVALSRLVYPTSVGFEYSARVRSWANGARTIVPGASHSLNPSAFVADEQENWLIPGDVHLLRSLVEAYDRGDAPERLRAAMWYHESAFRDYFVNNRWPMVVTGLEALVHIGGERDPRNSARFAGSTRVFCERLFQVAQLVGLTAISEVILREIYDRRSSIVHGQGMGDLDATTRALYQKTEGLLSTIIRHGLLQPTVASCFSSASAVQAAFPLR